MTKKHLRFPILILLGIYAIAELVLYPLAQKSGSDIVWLETFWIYILQFLDPLMDWIGLAAIMGFTVHSVYRYGVRGSVPLYISIACVMLGRVVMTVISVSIFQLGSLSFTYKGYIAYFSQILSQLFEYIFIPLVIVLAHFGIKRLREINRTKKNYCLRLKKDFAPEGETLPFTRIFYHKNPLLVSLLITTLSYAFSRTLLFIITTIPLGTAGYLIPIFYATSVLIPAVACYFVARFCIKLAEKDRLRIEKLEAEEAENEEEAEESEE